MVRKTIFAALIACAAFASPSAPTAHAADAPKIVIGIPGIPPIFSAVIAYVAQDQGFFKKYGANVELRPFDNGTAAARAVVAGDLDASFSGTNVIVFQIANAGIPLKAIYGLPHPDMALGSTDPKRTTCKDLVGQQVSIDTPGGVRSLALKAMLGAGCHMSLDQVQQVAMGSNTASAMASGQLTFGVVHTDDIPDIELRGHKKVTIIESLSKTNPDTHYLVLTARQDRIAQKRDGFVRAVAGLIATGHFIADPKNNAKVTKIAAAVTGRDAAIASAAVKGYLAIGVWTVNDDGMNPQQIGNYLQILAKSGNIKEGKTPPTYAQLVDPSIWRDAEALVKKGK